MVVVHYGDASKRVAVALPRSHAELRAKAVEATGVARPVLYVNGREVASVATHHELRAGDVVVVSAEGLDQPTSVYRVDYAPERLVDHPDTTAAFGQKKKQQQPPPGATEGPLLKRDVVPFTGRSESHEAYKEWPLGPRAKCDIQADSGVFPLSTVHAKFEAISDHRASYQPPPKPEKVVTTEAAVPSTSTSASFEGRSEYSDKFPAHPPQERTPVSTVARETHIKKSALPFVGTTTSRDSYVPYPAVDYAPAAHPEPMPFTSTPFGDAVSEYKHRFVPHEETRADRGGKARPVIFIEPALDPALAPAPAAPALAAARQAARQAPSQDDDVPNNKKKKPTSSRQQQQPPRAANNAPPPKSTLSKARGASPREKNAHLRLRDLQLDRAASSSRGGAR